jgi:DNA topoisomerase I
VARRCARPRATAESRSPSAPTPSATTSSTLDDFEVPSAATWTVVEGVEALDPELGGEPLETEEIPDPIPMRFTGTQDPPPKKKSTKRKKTSKKTTGKKTTRKKTTRKTTSAGK